MRIRMQDSSLVFFTLAAQTAAGLVLWLAGSSLLGARMTTGRLLITGLALALSLSALLASFLHLGSPLRAFQSIRNLSTSWLSREIACAIGFSLGLLALFLTELLAINYLGPAPIWLDLFYWLCAFLGVSLIFTMAKVYRLRTFPGWGNPLTGSSFFLTAWLLGGAALALAVFASQAPATINSPLRIGLLLGIIFQTAISLSGYALSARADPGRQPPQLALRGLRIGLLLASMVGLVFWGLPVGAGLILPAELIGRVDFYASRRRLGV